MAFSNLNVQVEVTVDTDSWKTRDEPNRPCPNEIIRLQDTSRNTSVELALLRTALCTRPPRCKGFSLADMWAWLRYRPAISDDFNLRLKPDWNDVDPHQKTILSDELGVGFSAELLSSELGFDLFVDTGFVVNVVARDAFMLGKTTKVGPAKSPDYIVLDKSNNMNVLECKGTQKSRKALRKAIADGQEQKDNLRKIKGPDFKHKLVTGLFIPQSRSKEKALIHIMDPEHENLMDILANVKAETLQLGILQISLAKHLSLMGLHTWANVLAETPTENLQQNRFPQLNNPQFSSESEDLQMTVSHFPPDENGSTEHGIQFQMSLSREIYELLTTADNLQTALETLNVKRLHKDEATSDTRLEKHSITSLGFTLNLEYIDASLQQINLP